MPEKSRSPKHRCLIIPLPVSPVERLAATFRDVLHMPDPSSMYILMGAVAANMLEGTPVWLMLIGPPSSGKTELLNSLLGVHQMYEGADISGEAAFLSGTAEKEKSKDATGGILRQIGDGGGLILNDFTSVLSKSPDRISTIMAILREAFGGRWTRNIGAEGGRALSWTGKLTMLAGCTGAIDSKHLLSAELGERWVYWRMPEEENESFAEAMMALSCRNGWQADLRQSVSAFYEELGLNFLHLRPRREFTNSERVHLHGLSALAARCRSGVTRDSYTHEVTGVRQAERATRLTTVLGQLLLGMDAIGVSELMRWRLLSKTALDSMPQLRRRIIQIVTTEEDAPTVEEMTEALQCSLTVTKRVIQDLEIQGVLRRNAGRVYVSSWMLEYYRRFVQVK